MVKILKSCRNLDIVIGGDCSVWGTIVWVLINEEIGHSSVVCIFPK